MSTSIRDVSYSVYSVLFQCSSLIVQPHPLMIIFSSKDLDKYGISHQSSSQLVFRGKLFTKGQTFAGRLRQLAVEIAQENMGMGQPSIVIDYDTHVTLWRAKRVPMGINTQPQNGQAPRMSSPSRPSVPARTAR